MAVREVSGELLECLRRELAVTWVDPEEDKRITAHAQRGMDYLDRRAETVLDYGEGTQACSLLVSYVIYARSQALDEFPVNYRGDLIALRIAAAKEAAADGNKV